MNQKLIKYGSQFVVKSLYIEAYHALIGILADTLVGQVQVVDPFAKKVNKC